MSGNMHVRASCIELQNKLGCHLSMGAASHDGLAIIVGYITEWQMGIGELSAVPYTHEQFLEVLDGITRPVTTLEELHQQVFPAMNDGFIRYYTAQQVDTVARLLLDRVLGVITAPGYVRLQEERVAPPAESTEKDSEALSIQAELVTDVLTIQASLQAEKVTQINPVDYRALIDATLDLEDPLDLREQCKPPSFASTTGGFFRSPEDVMFDHDMETAMARSQGHVSLSATGQSDRDLAKALALSQAMEFERDMAQAMDEEQQFERDMALAMAMSRAENGGTGDQELDSLLDSVMPEW